MSVRIVASYSRSRDGRTIHLDPCRRAGNAVPWDYASDKSLHEVVAEVRGVPWLRLCRSCWPAEAVATSEVPR